jgi:hypothetical protein
MKNKRTKWKIKELNDIYTGLIPLKFKFKFKIYLIKLLLIL